MAKRNRTIGSAGLEQGGANLGNDYTRNIRNEVQEDDTLNIVVRKKKAAAKKAPAKKAATRKK